jgi:poly(U)-specific endoribonuclease
LEDEVADIYQELWNIDVRGNGCIVAIPDGEGGWKKPDGNGGFTDGADAPVRLQVQNQARGGRAADQAPEPLFAFVDPQMLQRPTYRALIQLLNNYIVDARAEETETDAEQAEITAFLDAVLPTDVVQRAQQYVVRDLNIGVSATQFVQRLRKIWFEPYTNFFQNSPVHFASGFEHVFVGEGKLDRRFGAAERRGEVSGYHNWIKFHLDESLGRVNFLGHFFELQGGAGPDNPNVVTLRMVWDHVDLHGGFIAELFKSKGGFFVGTSPECEIAMGAVAFFEHVAGMLSNDKRRAEINGGVYDLVMHRSTRQNQTPGDFIRTFFPVYLGGVGGGPSPMPQPEAGRTVSRPVGTAGNVGPVIIHASLVNPAGPNDPGEWVELTNRTSAEVDLAGWEMRDGHNRPQRLEGVLRAGQTERFHVTRVDHHFMQLPNKGGSISVVDGNGRVVSKVSYRSVADGHIVHFTS